MSREDYQITRYKFLKAVKLCVHCAARQPSEDSVRCILCRRKVRKASQAYQDSGKRRQVYALMKARDHIKIQ